MHSEKKTSRWQYWMILPLLALSLSFFSFEKYPVVVNTSDQAGTMNSDTFPPLPEALKGKEIDTVITFDPVTFEEKVEYFESGTFKIGDANEAPAPGATVIDTVTVYDPETGTETITIVRSVATQQDSL